MYSRIVPYGHLGIARVYIEAGGGVDAVDDQNSSFPGYLGSQLSPVRRFLAASLAVWLLVCSGCSEQRQWGKCGVAGAILGAAAGVPIGLGVARAAGTWDDGSPGIRTAIVSSVVGAVVVGAVDAVMMHYICDPIVQPPPPMELPPAPPLAIAMAPPPPKHIAVPRERLVLRGIHFEFDKYEIRPQSAVVLDSAAAALHHDSDVQVAINGYCDIIGTDAYNMVLSEKRAQAVLDYLVAQGIAPDRMTANGFGKTNFVAGNDTDEGRAQNRRVELVPITGKARFQALGREPEISPEASGYRGIGRSSETTPSRKVAKAPKRARRPRVSSRGSHSPRHVEASAKHHHRRAASRHPVVVGSR